MVNYNTGKIKGLETMIDIYKYSNSMEARASDYSHKWDLFDQANP